MANGWASEGAVQEQIDSTVNDEITRVRQSLGHGESATECEAYSRGTATCATGRTLLCGLSGENG